MGDELSGLASWIQVVSFAELGSTGGRVGRIREMCQGMRPGCHVDWRVPWGNLGWEVQKPRVGHVAGVQKRNAD